MLKLLNTLTSQKEEFVPIKGNHVGMFVCGPTVYDYSHIGHIRTYVVFDVVAKYLRHKGFKLKYIMNITDIDDRIIDRAKEEGKDWKEISEFYEREFLENMKALGVDGVDKYIRATDHIKEMIKQVGTLLEKGYGYRIDEGIYFDISKFEDYGKLAKRTVGQAEDAVSRIDDSVGKRNKGDFVLWRFSEPGKPSWPSPWGDGRPGWHIEDTAITEKYLGTQYDIHGGGQDLIFPHHEAEITQQESASGKKPFVLYWLHSGLVTVNGQKMSKSLKNYIAIREALKDYSPEALRFLAIASHYRSSVEYREDLVKQSEAAIQRIREMVRKLEVIKKKGEKEEKVEFDEIIKNTKLEFENKMDDDFNTPEALAALFNFIRLVNASIAESSLDRRSAERVLSFLSEVDEIFGIVPSAESPIPDNVSQMVIERERLRKEKAWLEADKVRDELQNLGYSVEDTPYGPFVKQV